MTTPFKRALARCFWLLLGRRNLVRFGRFLLNAGRLDIANRMDLNGETLVQESVLAGLGGRSAVVFDVGANLGAWTLSLLAIARRQNAALEIHLFEPSLPNYAHLLEAIAPMAEGQEIRTRQLGFSNAPGEADFYVSSGGAGTDSVYRQHTLAPEHSVERISLSTVDLYCKEQDVDRVALLKVDAEGHDLKILEGAGEMLGQQRIEVIQFEYNFRWIAARCFLKDVFELLSPHGYCLGKVTPRGIEFYPAWHQDLETFVEGNYLACLPAWRERFPRIRWWKELS